MVAATISQRPIPGTDLRASAIGLSLDPRAIASPEASASLAAVLRRARERGVTLFDVPEGAGSDRAERLLAAAFPAPDPDLVVMVQRSTSGLASTRREEGDRTAEGDRSALARSVRDSNRRLAPHRVRLVDWVPSDDDPEARLRLELASLGTTEGVSAVVRRVVPRAVPTRPLGPPDSAELWSGSFSVIDRRLAPWLEDRSETGSVGFFARDPLGGGRLDGSRLVEASGPRRPEVGPVRVRELEREFAPVLALGFLTEGRRRTLAQASLRFVLRWPWVTAALVPLPAPERVDEILGAESAPELDADELRRVGQLAFDD